MRIFNHRFEQIALHVRQEQGRFSTQGEHLAPEKINRLERGAAYLLDKVGWIGPQSQQWAEAMLHARGIEGTRVLQGLLSLTKKHTAEAFENACEIALSHAAFRLRTIRFSTSIRSSDRWTITAGSSPPPCVARTTVIAETDQVF